MALEKYSLEIKENLDFRLVWADVMSKNDSGLLSSPRFPKRENFSLKGVGWRTGYNNSTSCLKQKRSKALSINIIKKIL